MKRLPLVEGLIVEAKEDYERHQKQYSIEKHLDIIQRDVEEVKSRLEKIEDKLNNETTKIE